NEFGPPEKKGVVRVKVCNGGWLLEPDSAVRTRATYTVFTDTGGLTPAFLANYACQNGISRLFDAVRKRVKDPKYALADCFATDSSARIDDGRPAIYVRRVARRLIACPFLRSRCATR